MNESSCLFLDQVSVATGQIESDLEVKLEHVSQHAVERSRAQAEPRCISTPSYIMCLSTGCSSSALQPHSAPPTPPTPLH